VYKLFPTGSTNIGPLDALSPCVICKLEGARYVFTPHVKCTTICMYLNSRHFAYVTPRTACTYTLTLFTLLVEHVISWIRINHMTTRSRWKFTICTANNGLTLYRVSTLYIFVTRGWPTVAETYRQSNKTDRKTVVFWRTFPLLIMVLFNIMLSELLRIALCSREEMLSSCIK